MPVIKLRGLPWSVCNQDIVEFLDGIKIAHKPIKNGAESVICIYLMTNSEGRPSGEAFIELEDELDLENAINLKNNQQMGKRYIEVFRSNYDLLNRHLEESAKNASTWQDPVVRLRGLPYGCTKQDVAQFFDGLKIAADDDGIMMVIDKSGRFNGEAFVEFERLDDALNALDRHKQKIANRYIEVFRSTFDELDHYSSPPSNQQNYQQQTSNYYQSGYGSNNRQRNDFKMSTCRNYTGDNYTSTNQRYKNYQQQQQQQSHRAKPYSRNQTNNRFSNKNSNNYNNNNNNNNYNNNYNNNNNNNNSFNNNYNNNKNNNRSNYSQNFSSNSINSNPNNNSTNNMRLNYDEDNFENSDNFYDCPSTGSASGNNQSSYVCEKNHSQYEKNRGDDYNFNENDDDSYYEEDMSRYVIKMRGLPFSSTQNDIRQFFEPLNPINIEFLKSRDRRPSGECQVYFGSHSEACEAMKYDKKFIGNRYIELFLLSGSMKSANSNNNNNNNSNNNNNNNGRQIGSLMNKSKTNTNNKLNSLFSNFDAINTRTYSSGEPSSSIPPPPPPLPPLPPSTNRFTPPLTLHAKNPPLPPLPPPPPPPPPPPTTTGNPMPSSTPATQMPQVNEQMYMAANEMAQKMFTMSYTHFHQYQQQQYQQQQQAFNSNNNAKLNRRF